MIHPFQTITTSPDGSLIFAAARNHIKVISTKDHSVLAQWDDNTNAKEITTEQSTDVSQQETPDGPPTKVQKIATSTSGSLCANNYIRALAISPNGQYAVATTDTDKSVVVFSTDFANGLVQLKRQPFPKRPCAVALTDDRILVADKFGDVYDISYTEDVQEEKNLQPILGHVSMLTDLAIAKKSDKTFVLTGDRDEHIRVSNYPKSFVVKEWLFGHREFVSALCVSGDYLISGGGDDYLCRWNWYQGKLLGKTDLRSLLDNYFVDFHNVPERWATETSVPEVSVSKIVSINNNLFVVLVENVKCLLVFKASNDEPLVHVQTLELEAPFVDICSVSDGLIGTPTTGGLSKLIVDQEKLILKENWDINSIQVDDLTSLWYVNTLRKRSEH